MIYLEYDDGHNEPLIHSYEDRDDAIRRILGPRPTAPRSWRTDGKFFWFGKEVTAEEALAREVAEWDGEMATLETVLCSEDDERYEPEATVNGDVYRRVSPEGLEADAEHDRELAAKMRRGEKL